MLRVVIVDDEAPARRYLLRLLKGLDNIAVVGEASGYADAASVITDLQPDAVFMDIELGDGDGMELWSALTHRPFVIFVTAHADRAPRAFDFEALDYLLKPVSAARLADAVNRLQRARDAQQSIERSMSPGASTTSTAGSQIGSVSSISVRSHGTTKIIKIGTISAVVATGDYVELRLAAAKNELMYATLTKIAEQLPSPPFIRLSRSLLLNLDHVRTINPTQSMQVQVTFSTGAAPLFLGRIAAIRLRKMLV